MRILFITPTLDRGGPEKQLALAANYLRKLNYETAVMSLYQGGGWVDYLHGANVPVSVLQLPRSSLFKFDRGSLRMLLKISRHIRDVKPDVVVGFLYIGSVWASLAGCLARVPIVISSRRDCNFTRSNTPLPRWIERLSYQCVTKFAANCHAVAESMYSEENIPLNRIAIIYNGIDSPADPTQTTDEFRDSLGIPSDHLVVGMIAAIRPDKNQLMLVQTAKQVIEQYPKITFIIAGRYNPYQDQVQAEILHAGLDQHVKIIGPLADTSPLLTMLDIGILCSHTEGISNSILEYMAYGKPVIATRVGGNGEVIVENETGYLVDLNSADAMAQAILRLTADPELRRSMGERGRQRVKSLFSWESSLASWSQLFGLT